MPSWESGNRPEPDALVLVSITCPSEARVVGEAVGEGVSTDDTENQDSMMADAVAATEIGRSLWVAWRTWECEEDDEGKIALRDDSG